MSSIFSRIAAGELPAYKVAETQDFLAFLDVNPLREGHTLVIPKQEIDYIFDIEDEPYAGLMLFAKIVAEAIKKTIPCKKIGVAVVGLEVPHAHIHLIPIDSVSDMDFTRKKMKFEATKLEEIAAAIRANF